MKFDIHGEKLKITDGIKSHLESKIDKLDKYFHSPGDLRARIVAKVVGHEQIIEVTIPTNHFTIRAEVAHEDLYAAIDLVIDKIEKQIRKNKNRIKSKMYKEKLKDISLNFEDDMLEELEENEVVKYEKMSSKPMSTEEAILEMNLLGFNFLVYKNSDTDKPCVLYKRKDGNFGVIETD